MEDLTVGQSQFRLCIATSKNVHNFFLVFLRRANELTDTKYIFNSLFVVEPRELIVLEISSWYLYVTLFCARIR